MKFPALLLSFTLVCCVVIAGYIHSKRKQEIHLNKQASFLNIKFRVTRDVLGEYKDQLSQSFVLLEKTKKEVDVISKELTDVKSLVERKKKEVDACKGDKVSGDGSSVFSGELCMESFCHQGKFLTKQYITI